MAKKQVLVLSCDKCGKEGNDTSQYMHVTVGKIPDLNSKGKIQIVSTKDLCLGCLGAPGVNVEP